MIAFWSAVALLSAAALFFVLRPLLTRRQRDGLARDRVNRDLYREQFRELDADLQSGTLTVEQYEAAKRELEARLLEDADVADPVKPVARPARITAVVLFLLLPVGAFGVYLLVGTPAALDPQILAREAGTPRIDRQQLEAMVERLAKKLEQEPENPEGWVMLGRSYRYMERYADAARAYENAISRSPPDAGILADYADALAMAQGRQLAGKPETIIARALEIDPRNLKALALAGSVAFERKDFAGAVKYWERMLALVPPASDQARAIQSNVDEARSLGGLAQRGAPGVKDAAEPAAAAGAKLSGTVQLAPELKSKVAPTDTVLIYARAAEGPRMPLAIAQKQARDLPISFTLDDSMAMQAGMTISRHEKIIVVARISKAISATPHPGDLQGVSAPVRNTASGVNVVINTEIQ
ncbi:MAG TPA: c-type cytochrome biogenesis protein CcmI [Burkholderiales bacterium]|nr:c-type cytochrome biogenesis protein CcmI [Burkholderiales bacterium]